MKWIKSHIGKKIYEIIRKRKEKNKNRYKCSLVFLIIGGSYTWFLVNKASSAVRNAAHGLARGINQIYVIKQ